MAHQLMGTGAADSFDTEGEGGVFKDRMMAEGEDLLEQGLALGGVLVEESVDGGSRVAEPGRGRGYLLRIGGMGQKLDKHHLGDVSPLQQPASGTEAGTWCPLARIKPGSPRTKKKRRPRRAVSGNYLP